jgi:hypothetical protein
MIIRRYPIAHSEGDQGALYSQCRLRSTEAGETPARLRHCDRPGCLYPWNESQTCLRHTALSRDASSQGDLSWPKHRPHPFSSPLPLLYTT